MIQTNNKCVSKIVTIMAVFLGISTVLIGCKPEVTQPVLRGTAVPQSTIPITNANAAKLQELADWSLDGHVRWSGGIAFAPDDQMLAVSFDDVAEILLVDANNGNELQTLSGHTDDVNSVSFSADGSQLASSSWDKTVKIWDLAAGEITHSFDHPDTTYSAAFSPDGKLLAAGGRDGSVTLWDIETDQKVHTFDGHTELVQHVTFVPNGSHIVSASFDGTMRVWDVATGQLQQTLAEHGNSVWDVAFSPDQTQAASASTDGTIRLWELGNWQESTVLTDSYTEWYDVTFIANDLVAAASRNKLTLWDTTSEEELLTLEVNEGVQALAISNDRQLLASGGQGIVRLWGVIGPQ